MNRRITRSRWLKERRAKGYSATKTVRKEASHHMTESTNQKLSFSWDYRLSRPHPGRKRCIGVKKRRNLINLNSVSSWINLRKFQRNQCQRNFALLLRKIYTKSKQTNRCKSLTLMSFKPVQTRLLKLLLSWPMTLTIVEVQIVSHHFLASRSTTPSRSSHLQISRKSPTHSNCQPISSRSSLTWLWTTSATQFISSSKRTMSVLAD